jgi:hypothetical protein
MARRQVAPLGDVVTNLQFIRSKVWQLSVPTKQFPLQQ